LTLAWVIITYRCFWKRRNCVQQYCFLANTSLQKFTNGFENEPRHIPKDYVSLLGDITNIQVYSDDILITSNGTFEEHATIMEQVLDILQKANFRANVRKMLFW
jgi:hypothetical protein